MPDPIVAWLSNLGLDKYSTLFTEHEIDMAAVPHLAEADLERLGLPMGPRKKLMAAIATLVPQSKTVTVELPMQPRATSREAERRQVTVMFCDLVGSTALSQRLDPEDLSAIIGRYQSACTGIVSRYDGHVAKYLGDGILAYFGYPRAHEDDAERAVRTGLAIVDELKMQIGPNEAPLAVRIGIATGRVVVGELAGQGRSDEIVGEAPNLAARLQALAKPDAVLIAPKTYRLIGEVFDHEDLGLFQLKGLAQPVRVRQVVCERPAESRFVARRGGRLTPLVGRDQETALLLSRWRQALDAEGQVVLVSGEPGIGKSRIVEALRAHIAEPHTTLRFQCSPHHTNSPLHPLIEHLTRATRIEPDEPPQTKLTKLEATLALAGNDPAGIAPLFAAVLSIPTSGRYPPLDLSPQRQRQETIRALADQVVGLAERQPVLLIVEDVHWADPTSLEVVDSIVGRSGAAAILILVTFRPEFEPTWSRHLNATSLKLSRLSRGDCAAMVAEVAAGKALPAEILRQIVSRTDGVPLFVEELTKVVLEASVSSENDRGAGPEHTLQPDAIPSTLQDSLMARLDRLAPVKNIAQMGAVLGREFSYDMLAALTDLEGDRLQDALRQLEAAEILFRYGTPPEARYVFKHALVRDSAYESILKGRRHELHAQLARVLQDQFSVLAQTQPEVLALHLTAADMHEEAAKQWMTAGQAAYKRLSLREAIAHFTNALQLLTKVQPSLDRDRLELSLRTTIGIVHVAMKGWAVPEVREAYEAALPLADRVNDVRTLAELRFGLWLYHVVRAELAESLRQAEAARIAGESVGDAETTLRARVWEAQSLAYTGNFLAAEAQADELVRSYDVEYYRPLVHSRNTDPVCGMLAFRAKWLWILGWPGRAMQCWKDMYALSLELGAPYQHCSSLTVGSYLFVHLRRPDLLRQHAQEALRIATERSFPMFQHFLAPLCLAYADYLETPSTAYVQAANRLVEIYRSSGGRILTSFFLAGTVDALGKAGRTDEGLHLVDQLLDDVSITGERILEAELHRLRGELLQAQMPPDGAGAEECFLVALSVAREQQARSWELRAAMSLARLWVGQGKRADAWRLLATVYDWFTEGFDTADLKDAKDLLDSLA